MIPFREVNHFFKSIFNAYTFNWSLTELSKTSSLPDFQSRIKKSVSEKVTPKSGQAITDTSLSPILFTSTFIDSKSGVLGCSTYTNLAAPK